MSKTDTQIYLDNERLKATFQKMDLDLSAPEDLPFNLN